MEELTQKYETQVRELKLSYDKQIYELQNQLSLSKGANETLIN